MVEVNQTIQVQITKGDRLFVAESFDIPVVTQAETLDELMQNLREAITLQLEGEDNPLPAR